MSQKALSFISLLLISDLKAFQERNCGVTQSNEISNPWLAAFYIVNPEDTKSLRFACNGVLVSSRVIVTSKLCIIEGSYSQTNFKRQGLTHFLS